MRLVLGLLLAFLVSFQASWAVVSTTHFQNSFTPSGGTVFAFTFKTLSKDHVKVYLDDVLVQNSQYTVALMPSGVGGTVTFSVAPVGTNLVLRRETPKTQATAFPMGGKLATQDLENGLDRLTCIMQELGSGITGPQGPTGPAGPAGDIDGPASSTNNALAIWNGTGGNVLKDGPAPTPEGSFLKVVSGVWTAAAVSNSIPSGTIWLWDTNMASVPAGWEPMDGRTVTINGASKVTLDTRGKYLLCAASDDTGSSGFTGSTVRPGTVSGTKTHQHTQGGSVSVSNSSATGAVSSSAIAVGAGALIGNAATFGTLGFSPNPHNHSAFLSGDVQANTEASRPIEAAVLLIIKVD